MKSFHSAASRLLSVARQRQRLCELLVARARAADVAALRRLQAAESAWHAGDAALLAGLESADDIAVIGSLQQVCQSTARQSAQRLAEQQETSAQLAEAISELRSQQAQAESLTRLEGRHFEAWRHDAVRDFSHLIDQQAGRMQRLSKTIGGEP